jgi:hypothetical protein
MGDNVRWGNGGWIKLPNLVGRLPCGYTLQVLGVDEADIGRCYH